MGIFGNAFSGWHLVLILVVVLLLFGAAKLPALAQSVGQSIKILRSESRKGEPDPDLADDAPPEDRAGGVTNAEQGPPAR